MSSRMEIVDTATVYRTARDPDNFSWTFPLLFPHRTFPSCAFLFLNLQHVGHFHTFQIIYGRI